MSKQPDFEERRAKAASLGKHLRGRGGGFELTRAGSPQPPVGTQSCPRCGGRRLVQSADGRHVPCPRCTSAGEGEADGEPTPQIVGSGTADGRHRSADDYLVARKKRELTELRERVEEDEAFRAAYMRTLALAAGNGPGSRHRNNGR